MGTYLKFLADVNVEKLIVDEFRKLGYDITYIKICRRHQSGEIITEQNRNKSRNNVWQTGNQRNTVNGRNNLGKTCLW